MRPAPNKFGTNSSLHCSVNSASRGSESVIVARQFQRVLELGAFRLMLSMVSGGVIAYCSSGDAIWSILCKFCNEFSKGFNLAKRSADLNRHLGASAHLVQVKNTQAAAIQPASRDYS